MSVEKKRMLIKIHWLSEINRHHVQNNSTKKYIYAVLSSLASIIIETRNFVYVETLLCRFFYTIDDNK